MDVAMNGNARLRQLLAFGLAALLHIGLALIPLPRSAENPARPGIEPSAISVEVIAPAPAALPGPGNDMAPPAMAPDRAAQPVHTTARVARVTRVADNHAQRVNAAHARTPRSRVEVAPAEPHDPGISGLRPMDLDLGGHAAVPVLDDLSGRAPAGSTASAPRAHANGASAPGLARLDRHAYALRVRGLVAARKRYPARARRLSQEGEVSVRVRIAPDGRLLGQPRVTASSGAEALDREALRMVRQASPFPPSGATTAIDIAVPVRFALDER